MKKPQGDASAGWYDSPEHEGKEQYWNGKYWVNKTRTVGDEGPQVFEHTEKYLGKLLFRHPITSDWAFVTLMILWILSIFFAIKDEVSASGALLTYLIIPMLPLFAAIWYLCLLIVLVPRRILDKRKGLVKFGKIDSKHESDSVSHRKTRNPSRDAFIVTGVLAIVIGGGFLAFSNSSGNEGDKYFAIEQKISRVVGEWNVAATPASEAVAAISNGTMTPQEARAVISTVSSDFAVIHNKLRDECTAVPDFDLNAPGIKGAVAKGYSALKVTCDLLPQESAEVLLLIREQISPTGTQEQIDYHSSQLSQIINKRKDATVDALKSIREYGSDADKQLIDRLLKSLG
jgi:hypothetical protein